MTTATVVYTDGACRGNPGPGGWAWAEPGGAFASGAAAHTTNQRMEIEAAYEAVKAHPEGPLEIVSDSTYVVNCFRDRWWEGWMARGWKNAAKQPVANRDLWEPLIALVRSDPQRVHFRWVKGHGTDPMNDLVDRLAVEAAATQVGRSGDAPPTDLGPADRVQRADRRAAGSDPLVAASPSGVAPPDGHRLLVVGHKPPELGGYDDNPTATAVRSKLAEIIGAKAKVEPDLVVLTGVRLGAEMLGAEAALDAGVPYVAVLPFPGPETRWAMEQQLRYRELLRKAKATITLERKAPETAQKVGGSLQRRDAWLARHAHEAVVVWDGREPFIGRLVRSLQDHVGEENVWVVAPPTS